jgi:hypothetical protein
MATTTNYSWTTPDDTALVKDGASAIRTLGTSVDTTTKNLNPSTTLGDIEYRSSTSNTNTRVGIGSSGQALTVVAGVPSWAASPTSTLTTTGDTLYASAANTLARLGIGSTGQVLTVAGGVPSWAAPGGALALSTIASGSLTSGTTLTLSSLSSYDYLILVLNGVTWDTGSSRITVLVNNDNTGVYIQAGIAQIGNTIYTSRNLTTTSINTGFGLAQGNTQAANTYIVTFTNCKSTGFTNANVDGVYATSAPADASSAGQYVYKVAAAVSSLVVGTLNGYTFNGTGTYQLLGA